MKQGDSDATKSGCAFIVCFGLDSDCFLFDIKRYVDTACNADRIPCFVDILTRNEFRVTMTEIPLNALVLALCLG